MALSDEDKAQFAELLAAAMVPIKDEFSKMVNGAAKTAATSATKGLKEQVDLLANPENLKTTMETLLADRLPAKADPAKQDQVTADKAELAKLQRQLDDVNKKLAAESEEKTALKTKQLREEERSTIDKALEKAGIQSPAIRKGAALTLFERGAVARDEDGNVVLKFKDRVLDVEGGIKDWTATDEGKEFLPPKQTGGSGDPTKARPGAGGAIQPGFYDPAAVQAALRNG